MRSAVNVPGSMGKNNKIGAKWQTHEWDICTPPMESNMAVTKILPWTGLIAVGNDSLPNVGRKSSIHSDIEAHWVH